MPPDAILCHDPHARDQLVHRDHRIVGQVTQDAIYPYARDHLHYPEQIRRGVEPHRCDHCLLWDADQPNAVVDVTDSVDAQAKALQQRASQLRGLMGDADPTAWLRERSRAAAHGLDFEHAERFRMLRAPA